MLFNSYEFIFIFLPITWAIYYLVYYGTSAYKLNILSGWLVLASLFFYAWWSFYYVILLIFSILFNFYIGIVIKRYCQHGRAKKTFLTFGIIINLSLLAYYKYANFFVETINHIHGLFIDIDNIILPLAISFFTFQQIAYLVDTYQEKVDEHSLLNYSLFVVFFPQLIAGPIVHHKEMLPQFKKIIPANKLYENISIGLTIFLIGLFKKVFIADNLSLPANALFDLAEQEREINMFQAFAGSFAYSFQIYFDFSGYSDMAIGIARLFGIRLIINFNSPYRSNNISEFWRRWHISLSRFLRDYIYIPLGGNKKGTSRRYLNLMTVMLVGGLWHGAGWNFLFWGGLHGMYLVCHQVWRKVWKTSINTWWSIVTARLVTFFFVTIAWIFFRASSFNDATFIINSMFSLPEDSSSFVGFFEWISLSTLAEFGNPFNLGYGSFIYTILALLIIWVFPNTQELMHRYKPAYNYDEDSYKPVTSKHIAKRIIWNPGVFWALLLAAISWISIIQLNQVKEFLYFQF